MVKFFRTASEFLSVSQVKHVAGSPLVDFSAEFSSQQTHSLPGALPGSGQGWFLGAPPIPLGLQALALQLLRWAPAAPLCCHCPLCPQPSPPWALQPSHGWDGGFGVEFSGTAAEVAELWGFWRIGLLWGSWHSLSNHSCLSLMGEIVRDAFIAWGWGNLGFFSVCRDCLEGEMSRGFCAHTACSGGFAPGAVDLCTTAWAKHLCTADSFCFSGEILLKLSD